MFSDLARSESRPDAEQVQFRPWRIAVVLFLITTLAAIASFLLWLFLSVPHGGSMLQQMMARKSRTMEEIMDGMIREDFVRLQREAQSMKYYGTLINHFLAFPEYEKLSVEFDQSLDDLSDTAARKDASAAQEAVLRLQRSCIECHVILNQRMRSS